MSSVPICITGASGFVGRALVKLLCTRQISVNPLLRSAPPPADKVFASPYVRPLIMPDITPDSDWQTILQPGQTLVHLAARVHLMQDRAADPLAAYRQTNCRATLALALAAAKHGVKRMVFLSTVKVLGEHSGETPFSAASSANPCDPYAVSKWEAEQGLAQISAQTGLEIVIIRPPLVYGPGVKANFLQLMRWVARGVPLPLAALNNRRSMIYLDNLADLIVHCCQSDSAPGQTFLASDGHDVSTPELIRTLAQAMQRPARLYRFPMPLLRLGAALTGQSAALERLCGSLQVDISATRQRLSWNIPHSFAAGIADTVAAFAYH